MERLDRLQHLRGIAALLVLFSHLDGATKPFSGREPVVWFSSLFDGSFGVDIFFVISGFIMVYTCRHKFGDTGAWAPFLWRRLVRIAPLYWLLTLCEAALLYLSRLDSPEKQITLLQLVLSMLFIPFGWHDDKFRPLLGPGWSLNYEMFFYVLFAAVLFLPIRKSMVALGVLFFGFALAGLLSPPTAPLMAWTRPIILEFFAGACLGAGYLAMRERGLSLKLPWPSLIIVGLIALELLTPDANGDGLSDWDWMNWGLALAIVAIATLTAPATSRGLGSRIMTAIGDASYSIYLVHVIALALWETVWTRLLPTSAPALAAYVMLGLAICLVGGWLTHIWVERPMTRWLNRRFEKKPQPRDETAPAIP